MSLLEVKHLKKYFKTQNGLLHAVDDISFNVEKGETLGIVGESGCGKSTLGRCVLQLHTPTSGEVILNGQSIVGLNKAELKAIRPKMQMIFQDPYASLNPRMSVSQIIAEPLIIYKTEESKKAVAKKVATLMDTVGLARRFADFYPHELDGGRRQRIGIARALSLNPDFIVCDEPVSALDVSIQAQILNLMQDLQDQRKLTYLFITHDLSVVKHISDTILVMYLGKIVELTSSKQLFKNPLHPYTKALLSAIPVPKLKEKKKKILLSGEISCAINPGEGCRFAGRCPNATEICFTQSPTLKDYQDQHFVSCHHVN